METNSYYITTENGLQEYTYNDLYYAVSSGALLKETKVLIYDNLTRAKTYMKAGDVLFR